MNPVFEGYAEFARFLECLSSGTFGGCRKGGCLFGACRVRDRVGGNGVDYRCEWAQFPCEEHGFPEGLRQRWEADNRRIGEVGIENYYEEVKNRPRYPQAPGIAAKCLPCLVWNGECRSPRGYYNYSR
jgi:hypothetical protein